LDLNIWFFFGLLFSGKHGKFLANSTVFSFKMLQLDVSLIVVFLIVWILVYSLSKVFFNPLRKVMHKRDDKIQGANDAYQKSTEVYEQTVDEIEEMLRSARALSQQTKESIERKAALERERMLAEINEEFRNKIDEAKRRVEKQIIGLKRKLESEADHLSNRIEHKLLDQ